VYFLAARKDGKRGGGVAEQDGARKVKEALDALAVVVGREVVVIASSWRADTAVNLDREASRVLMDVLATVKPDDRLAMVLVGERGQAAFADDVRRLLEALSLEPLVCVPWRVSGALTMVALCGEEIVLSPGASVGAHDVGEWTASGDDAPSELAAWWPAAARPLPEEPVGLGWQMARRARQQAQCHEVLSSVLATRPGAHPGQVADRLSVRRLGADLGLGARELVELSLAARVASVKERGALWSLFRAVEDALGMRKPERVRYVETGVSDEVEFEPAEDLPGALILSARRAYMHVLDSGSPDADTGLYRGQWTRWGVGVF
jgi:hypothetical protein